jgi:hypothetical protein
VKRPISALELARLKGIFRLSEATSVGIHPEAIRRLMNSGHWLAVDRRAGIPRVDFVPVRIVRMSGVALTLGVDEHDIEGVPVRITSPARTVVDCFKFRNKIGIDVAVEALREYRRLRKGTFDELWRQADRLRMTRVMRPYWDAMSS